MRRSASLALTCVVLAFATFPAPGDPEGEWRRPYAPVLPGAAPLDAEGYPTLLAIRVLGDDGSGPVPLAGARVSGWSEDTGPESVRSEKLGEGATDEFGIANVRWAPSPYPPFHWVVEAKGWAVWHDVGLQDEVILVPATTRRFRVLGPLGEPLVGARVEWFHGCPHAPTLRSAVSDGAGVVTLEDLAAEPGGELWITAPGVAPGPYSFSRIFLAREGALPTLATDPGRTARGLVVDRDGSPRPGLTVREIGYPRGPVTTTDEKGRFVLHGVDRGALGVFLPDRTESGRPAVSVEQFVEDVPLRITLDPERPRAHGEDETRHRLDVLVVRNWPESDASLPVDGIPVTAARLTDGFVARGETGRIADGLFSGQLPPGEYRVIVGGGLSEVVRAERMVIVPGTESSPVRFVLDSQPTLWIRGEKPDEDLTLRIPGERGPVRQHSNHLPATGPAVLVYGDDPVMFLPVGPLGKTGREVVFPVVGDTQPATLVRVRIRSEDPEVAADEIGLDWDSGEWVDEPVLGKDGRWTARPRRVGRAVLHACCPGHQSEYREVNLPTEAPVLELPEIVLRRSADRTFRVVDAAGKPVTEVEPTWPGGGNEILDDDGRFTIEVGPRPEPLMIATPTHLIPPRSENWYPLPVALSLTSPEEIRFPGGRITIEVRDETGPGVPAIAYVDGLRLSGQGTLDLRGVPAGPHRIFVGSPGRVGEVRRIVLKEGEHRRIALRLPRR